MSLRLVKNDYSNNQSHSMASITGGLYRIKAANLHDFFLQELTKTKRLPRISVPGLNAYLLLALAGLLSLAVVTTQGAQRPIDFGRQWVRSHRFTLMGLTQRPVDTELYLESGLNTGLAWRVGVDGADLREVFEQAGIPWLGHIRAPAGPDQEFETEIVNYMQQYQFNRVGWLVNDEPRVKIMPTTGQTLDWIRQHYPDMLALSNAPGIGANPWRSYLGHGIPRYDYDYRQYVEDFIHLVKPDVMMFDIYPFQKTGGVSNVYFLNLQIVREAALRAGLPYWVFVQSYVSRRENRRLPSDSDNRLQLFSALTFGYTGMAYFVYDGHFPRPNSQGFLQADEKTPLLDPAAKAHRELLNIAGPVRFLTSEEVLFIKATGGSPVHQGLLAWDKQHRPGSRWFKGISIDLPERIPNPPEDQATNWVDAPYLGGLLGLFRDDQGQQYFMLTNTWHSGTATAGQRELTFHIRFDPTVKSIQHLSRITRRAEVLAVGPEAGLTIKLPGGTGDLFKFGSGSFVGI